MEEYHHFLFVLLCRYAKCRNDMLLNIQGDLYHVDPQQKTSTGMIKKNIKKYFK